MYINKGSQTILEFMIGLKIKVIKSKKIKKSINLKYLFWIFLKIKKDEIHTNKTKLIKPKFTIYDKIPLCTLKLVSRFSVE